MTLSETEEYNTGAFHSHASLGNPHKEWKIKSICHSEPFMKPKMALKEIFQPQKFFSYFKFKKRQNDPQQTDFSTGESRNFLRRLPTELYREHQQVKSEQTSAKAEKHYKLDYCRHESLRNQCKPRKSKRMNSQPFSKPSLPLKKPQQTDFSLEESKRFLREMASELYRVHQFPLCLSEEKTIVPQDLYKPRKNVQPRKNITDNSISTLPQKNKSSVSSEKTSERAGSLKISKSEWENITRPSAKVILDPNTANPTLKLSGDGRSVRTKTYEEFQSSKGYHEYQRKCKHQYNSWTCVQAKDGYSTGKHYWEVDVKGKCDWRVGVVKKSAQRNGFIKLNTAAGYWTLRLQLGSLMALTEPVTKLNQAPPSKIGVHLDLEEGRVSFYDAVKRKHIYTIKAEFSKGETIYPVFGTVETDEPLKII